MEILTTHNSTRGPHLPRSQPTWSPLPDLLPIHGASPRRPARGNPQPENIAEQLFPLRLTPFEAMALYDDWPDYPMTCGAIFRFQGKVRWSKFLTAVKAANLRNPMMEANITGTGRNAAWIPGAQEIEPQWLGEAEPKAFTESRPYDLRSEPGARLWVQQRGSETVVYSEFHHSTCDGAGGLSYMEDIFGLYALAVNEGRADASRLPPSNPLRLLQRGKFEIQHRWGNGNLWSEFKESVRMMSRRPVPLAPGQGVAHRQSPRYFSRTFDQSNTSALRERAASLQVSVNDLMIGELTQTICAWNEERSQENRGWLRILIPVNLRNRADLAMTAANRIGYGFVTRRLEDCAVDCHEKKNEFMKSLAEENAWMRRMQMPTRLLRRFSLLQETGTWPLVFSPSRCLATAVFSNLGNPTRRFRIRFPRQAGLIQVGNLLMTGFQGMTALRPLTRAGLFVSSYGNQITITARFDPQYFGAEDSGRFLDLFQHRMEPQRRSIAA